MILTFKDAKVDCFITLTLCFFFPVFHLGVLMFWSTSTIEELRQPWIIIYVWSFHRCYREGWLTLMINTFDLKVSKLYKQALFSFVLSSIMKEVQALKTGVVLFELDSTSRLSLVFFFIKEIFDEEKNGGKSGRSEVIWSDCLRSVSRYSWHFVESVIFNYVSKCFWNFQKTKIMLILCLHHVRVIRVYHWGK